MGSYLFQRKTAQGNRVITEGRGKGTIRMTDPFYFAVCQNNSFTNLTPCLSEGPSPSLSRAGDPLNPSMHCLQLTVFGGREIRVRSKIFRLTLLWRATLKRNL
jgi:hypothetical protein